ncbi:hypothetical protein ETAA8_08290 [Anatilimnocola aggregata]|uniref:Uncharacterized protein n=1 Tax=Anatilimnocola aggregata TaxID=2528021 RepID=A0A517Y696_9BACT|nr:hypothetical protein [Anatilimnocola aggregata]QDU25758.1 hypothetical protein ETAA8_08290 [Anatilimnocola aggregata]
MKTVICCFATLLLGVSLPALAAAAPPAKSSPPLALTKGPHLFLDEHWIARSEGVERKVISPERFLEEPVVTSSEVHQNWQPFLTVLHDATLPAEQRFRVWYNADTVKDPKDGAWLGVTGLMTSLDGIHWPGPYDRLAALKVDGAGRFNASVIDDGPQHPIPAERYKMMYFDSGKYIGPRVAFSPDGQQWTMHNGGKPVLTVQNGEDIWSAGYDPIRQRYFLMGKLNGFHSWTTAEGNKVNANIRRVIASFSNDFKTWSPPKTILSPDEKDSGITQWYAGAGFLARGDLLIGFLRELRDDLSPEGVPAAAVSSNGASKEARRGEIGVTRGSGMGYTVLAWSRDGGESWQRDRYTDKFLAPDPRVGTWDHAMAWVGSSVPVGDELYLYYAGYRWGHKYRRSVDRQLGLVKMKQDRFVARQAGEQSGSITTPVLTIEAEALTLNVTAPRGEVRAQIITADGQPIPGYLFADCKPITTDSLAAPLAWKQPLAKLQGESVRLVFSLKNASLFAMDGR